MKTKDTKKSWKGKIFFGKGGLGGSRIWARDGWRMRGDGAIYYFF